VKEVSREVGDLIKSLYEKDEEYAADDPDVRLVTILENYDSDYSDSDDALTMRITRDMLLISDLRLHFCM
jgi:hypothetical protein